MSISVTNSRRTQPTNPSHIKTLSDAMQYINQLHADLYPQYQSLPQNVPQIMNLSNGTVMGSNTRSGRGWTVSIIVKPTNSGPSVASGASLMLPFIAANVSVFTVSHGTSLVPATVQQGSSTLVLPNWSTIDTVTIYGKADE